MKSKKTPQVPQSDMLMPRLDETVNPAHPQVCLTAVMPPRDHKPETCFAGLDYEGSGMDDVRAIIAGKKRGVPEPEKRWMQQTARLRRAGPEIR